MSEDISISVKNLSKKFRLYDSPKHRLKEALHPLRKSYHRDFWALRDVNFNIPKGSTFGIIGRNGSGKSTLLQIVCGVLQQTTGSVTIQGRISALLELGSGFNPEYTGRQNVYMNGAILGLTRNEVNERIESIIDFADIGEFIDQPLKTYSSGMAVRLAFAVAASFEPEVLIVDEALAVGDVKFQAKCFRRFEDLVNHGTSVLFVTHSTEQIVRHCDRAILLENGGVLMEGEPKEVTNRYLDLLFGVDRMPETPSVPDPEHPFLGKGSISRTESDRFENRPGYNSYEYRWGSREAEIVDFLLTTDGMTHSNRIKSGQALHLAMWVDFKKPVSNPIFALTIKTPDGVTVYGCNSKDFDKGPLVVPAQENSHYKVVFHLTNHNLGMGDYLISLGVVKNESGEIIPLDRRYDSIHFTVLNELSRAFGLVELSMKVEIEQL